MGNWNLAIRMEKSMIISLYKKGGKQKCENYITL